MMSSFFCMPFFPFISWAVFSLVAFFVSNACLYVLLYHLRGRQQNRTRKEGGREGEISIPFFSPEHKSSGRNTK